MEPADDTALQNGHRRDVWAALTRAFIRVEELLVNGSRTVVVGQVSEPHNSTDAALAETVIE